MVKETDLKSVGLCPRRFESCSCRLSDSITVSIPACHAGDQGSIPCPRVSKYAAIAQLGERKTEDLEVTGSIPVGSMIEIINNINTNQHIIIVICGLEKTIWITINITTMW